MRPSKRIRGQLEFLDALAGIDLGRIDVAVHRHGVDPVKLPGAAAVMTEAADHGAVVAGGGIEYAASRPYAGA
jgi:hypothetical protein